MSLNDARSLTREALFERRKHAIALHQKGLTAIEIAQLTHTHRNTVGEWIAAWKKNGSRVPEPRRAGRRKGSGRSLTGKQEQEIQRILIDEKPEQLKMPFALWTRDAVRILIHDRFGMEMPVRTAGEYLKRWNFTPQKPVRRAYERSPKAMKRWLEDEYPAIRKRAKEEGAEIQWGDETGLRSDDVNGRGYAPKGQTPVRPCKGAPERVNLISTVTNQGKVRFMFYPGRFNAAMLIQFMRRILKDMRRKVFLILDNLPVHHSKAVRAWAAKRPDRIELFYLPSYSPELNPDEYLNNDLKKRVSGKPDSRQKGRLKKTAFSAMRSIQKQRQKVRNYFKARDIQYAA